MEKGKEKGLEIRKNARKIRGKDFAGFSGFRASARFSGRR
jgi:hypothetical protein